MSRENSQRLPPYAYDLNDIFNDVVLK